MRPLTLLILAAASGWAAEEANGIIKRLTEAQNQNDSLLDAERIVFVDGKWSRPYDIRSAAAASAALPRADPGRAGGPGRPGALGPVAAGERPPRAQAVADRIARRRPQCYP